MSRTCLAASGPSALPGVRSCGAGATGGGGGGAAVSVAGGVSGGFGSVRGVSRTGFGRGLLAGAGEPGGDGRSPTGSGPGDSRGVGSIVRGGGGGTSSAGRSAGVFALAEAHADD